MAYQKLNYARIIASDDLNSSLPIGKVELAFDTVTSKGLSVYYFKGAGNVPLVENTLLSNVYLHPLRIPKVFKSVQIARMNNLSFDSLSLSPDADGSIGTITEGPYMRINEEDTEDINGLFMLGFEPYSFEIYSLLDYWDKNPLDLKNWKSFLKLVKAEKVFKLKGKNKSRAKENLKLFQKSEIIDSIPRKAWIYLMDKNPNLNIVEGVEELLKPGEELGGLFFPEIDDLQIPNDFSETPPFKVQFPPNFVGYSGISGCPRFAVGRIPNNVSTREAESTEEDANGRTRTTTFTIEESNLVSCFFKFNNHFFLPMTLPNGNTFYYAFENENIIRYWLYKENQAAIENKSFAIAANSPIYSENILGLEICKDIRIVEVGSSPIPFEQ